MNIEEKKTILEKCKNSYGKNIRLMHLRECLQNKNIDLAIEFGCREGHLLHNIIANKKIGYDLEPLDVYDDVEYHMSDINNLSKGFANLIICSEVIEHIEEDGISIKKMYDCLKINGALFLTTINNNIKEDKSEIDKERGHIRRYGKELKEKIEKQGFKTLKFYPIRSSYYYDKRGKIKDYLISEDIKEGGENASGWVYFGIKEGKNE